MMRPHGTGTRGVREPDAWNPAAWNLAAWNLAAWNLAAWNLAACHLAARSDATRHGLTRPPTRRALSAALCGAFLGLVSCGTTPRVTTPRATNPHATAPDPTAPDPTTPDATASGVTEALDRFDAQKSEFIARCEAFERTWPGYRDAIFLEVDGVEQPAPMNDRRIAMRDLGEIELEYEGGGSERGVTVTERSSLSGEGALRTWVRRLTVHGVASGRDIWVHVPVRDATGAPIAVEVNGAPLHAEPGVGMVRVPLARDESTRIALPVRWP